METSPNSLDVKTVKASKDLHTTLPPEHISDACDLLLSNLDQRVLESHSKEQKQNVQAQPAMAPAEPSAEKCSSNDSYAKTNDGDATANATR